MARTKNRTVLETGDEVPEFNLPSAQGGQLQLSMRTAIGPVVVVFYDGRSEEDEAYFRGLATKEREINLAAASIVGIGKEEPQAARDFVRRTGMKSYVLYDYTGSAVRDYGLLEGDRKRGEHARPATFLIGADHKIVQAWVGERPDPDELLAKVSEITGLPKPAEEEAEATEATEGAGSEAGSEAGAKEKPKKPKLSPEERERRRAERQAARSSGEE